MQLRHTLTICLLILTIALLAISLAAYIPGLWLCDLASQLRLAWLWALLPISTILGIIKAKKSFAISLLAMLIDGLPVAQLYLPALPIAGAPSRVLTLLNYNTEFQHNIRHDLLGRLIADRKPVVVAMVEINDDWFRSALPFLQEFKYHNFEPAGAGMAFFSKYPITAYQVRSFGRSHHPRIFITLDVDGQAVDMVLAHPTTPRSQECFDERNAEILEMAKEIASLKNPRILVGDLNCGPWSHALNPLRDAGLRDSQQGCGPQASWPARTGRVMPGMPIPPLIPIDHVFVDGRFRVKSRVAGPAINSDHLPVTVVLEL